MATGDLHNNIEKLRQQLGKIKYPEALDTNALNEGHPAQILPIIHYALLNYSPTLTRFIVESGFELFSKNDYKFLEGIFKLLRVSFDYNPVLKIGQMLQVGFAERKVMMMLDLVNIARTKAKELRTLARKTGKLVAHTEPLAKTTPTKVIKAVMQETEIPQPMTFPTPVSTITNSPPREKNEKRVTFSNDTLMDIPTPLQLPNPAQTSAQPSYSDLFSPVKENIPPPVRTNIMPNYDEPVKQPPASSMEPITLMLGQVMQQTAALTAQIQALDAKVSSFMENTEAQIVLLNGKIKMLEHK